MDGIDLAGSTRKNSQSAGRRLVFAADSRAILSECEFREEAADSSSAHRQSSSPKGTRQRSSSFRGQGTQAARTGRQASGRHTCRAGEASGAFNAPQCERNNDVAESAPPWTDAKKKSFCASERTRSDVVAARERFEHRRRRWRRSRLWFVDESGVNLSLARQEAWAPRGERIVDYVPGRRWETFSLIAALNVEGVHAPLLLPGAMNTDSMREWTRNHLAPVLKPGDIVIWDNLGIHRDPEVSMYIRASGARLEFLPPYSPDLNPIENAWSKAKSRLRTRAARTWDALVQGVADALQSVTPNDALGWFCHCGYMCS
jgi:transposase